MQRVEVMAHVTGLVMDVAVPAQETENAEKDGVQRLGAEHRPMGELMKPV